MTDDKDKIIKIYDTDCDVQALESCKCLITKLLEKKNKECDKICAVLAREHILSDTMDSAKYYRAKLLLDEICALERIKSEFSGNPVE